MSKKKRDTYHRLSVRSKPFIGEIANRLKVYSFITKLTIKVIDAFLQPATLNFNRQVTDSCFKQNFFLSIF